MNHPYFDEIDLHLNPNDVRVEEPEPIRSAGRFAPSSFSSILNKAAAAANASVAAVFNPQNDHEFRKYQAMGEEVKQALLQARGNARAAASAVAAPAAVEPRTCPYCDATVVPNAQGACDYCGGML